MVPFQFPAVLRVHSGEGVNGRLWLYYMAMVSVNIVDQNVHIRENFLFSRMGDTVFLHAFDNRFLLLVGLVMASEEGPGSRLLSTAKSMVKALSGRRSGSPPKTPPKSPSPDLIGGEGEGGGLDEEDRLNTTPEELITKMGYRAGISGRVPEMRSENESDALNPDIRKTETSLPSERSYAERISVLHPSEIRLNLDGPADFPDGLRNDYLSPLPRFSPHSPRLDNHAVGERVEDYGHLYRRPDAGDARDHYSGYNYSSHDHSYLLPPKAATVFASEVCQSVRFGRSDHQNVTQRETKRPKERSRDQAYRKRYSMGATVPSLLPESGSVQMPPRGGHTWPREVGHFSPPAAFGSSSHVDWREPRSQEIPLGSARGVAYAITLIHEGVSANCMVWPTMMIAQLRAEAVRIFRLDQEAEIILVLFTAMPETLRGGNVSGPPRIVPGSKVMVFHFSGPPSGYTPPGAALPRSRSGPPDETAVPALNSKLLASFKLPKFDGVARSWKAWEKSFQRFLGLH